METKTILWLVGGGIALIAISIVVNITIINPPSKDVTENPSGVEVPTQAEELANDKLCDEIQAKIDAEGRPGWDGLSETLQAEIEASGDTCTLQGNGKQF